MLLTVAYITSRRNCRWQWFADSLVRYCPPELLPQLDVIFIDRHLWGAEAKAMRGAPEVNLGFSPLLDQARLAELTDVVAGRFAYRHLPPLPNVYQGPFRLTGQDIFYAGLGRNTAIVAARAPYVAFVDDLSVLMPSWIHAAIDACQFGGLTAGMYAKARQMRVEAGEITAMDQHQAGMDSRWHYGSDAQAVSWHGSAVYGCSFVAPRHKLLEVDGNDAGCVGQGGEDYDLGIRLERAGCKVVLDRRLLTYESEEAHSEETPLPRKRKVVTSALPSGYDSLPVTNVAEKHFSDHVMINLLTMQPRRTAPFVPTYPDRTLAQVAERFRQFGLVPVPRAPTTDWRDGAPLSTL